MKAGQKKLMTHTKLAVIDIRALAEVRGGIEAAPCGDPPPRPDIVRTPGAPVTRIP